MSVPGFQLVSRAAVSRNSALGGDAALLLDPEQYVARRDGIKVNCAGVVAMV